MCAEVSLLAFDGSKAITCFSFGVGLRYPYEFGVPVVKPNFDDPPLVPVPIDYTQNRNSNPVADDGDGQRHNAHGVDDQVQPTARRGLQRARDRSPCDEAGTSTGQKARGIGRGG